MRVVPEISYPINNSSIIWELLRNAHSWAHSRPIHSESLGMFRDLCSVSPARDSEARNF